MKFGGLFTYVLIDVHASNLAEFDGESGRKESSGRKETSDNSREWERDWKHYQFMLGTSANAKAASINNGKKI